MTRKIFHPSYFGPIDQYVSLHEEDEIILEKLDNYQKQTYRTRQYIYGANGSLLLNIPIKHRKGVHKRQHYKDVKIENDFKWQQLHWRSIETAYRTSPFFEFYEDDFIGLYEKTADYLYDFNVQCTETVLDALGLPIDFKLTDDFMKSYDDNDQIIDERRFAVSKREAFYELKKYNQVFQDKYGYIENLTILDLLFNLGPSAQSYLSEVAAAQ
ncbi:MAG: WbqC family protein [Psychroflexus halocasei]|uniref:WbqC family protein n=1 Tax=Psychroflexus sp. S27 TaxID=1982757 RepID=UPI00268CE56B|nr:WbqC family protein [Psychroflexus sp. S27]